MEDQILSLSDYYKAQFKRYGWKLFTKLSDTHYPYVLALGIYFPKEDLCRVAKVGNWKLRLQHEQGHREGLKHVPLWKVGYVMHPWGIFRGNYYE